MIQILGLRDIGNKKMHAFFERGWRAPSVAELMARPEVYLADIPEDERWNLYFTVHDCEGTTARDFTRQWVVPYDIDHVDPDQVKRVAEIACEALRCEQNKVAIVSSGRGIQIHIPIETPIETAEYFTTNRPLYKVTCSLIQQALKSAKLTGDVDSSVFSMRRLMRMPATINRKPKLEDKFSAVIQGYMEPHGWTFLHAVNDPNSSAGDTITKEAFKKYPRIDTKAVLEGCGFLNFCKTNAKNLTEPQWYAQNSILGHMPGGMELAHEFSKPHHDYSESKTTAKVEQALAASGPRTCENINTLWNGCANCPHFKKIVTPVTIRGDDFISSEGTGFYHETTAPNGTIKIVPAYADIIKYYNKTQGKTLSVGKNLLYKYDADLKVWVALPTSEFKSFVYNIMDPEPSSHIVNETFERISMTVFKDIKWFDQTVGLVNMQNCVYDIKNDTMLEHNIDYGFRNRVEFAFDPKALCPKFMDFLGQVTQDDISLQNILQEFIGYTLSGDECWLEKGLILLGEGRNGKSTFNHVVKALVGAANYSSVGLSDFKNANALVMTEGKLVNIADENDPQALLDSSIFKMVISGEDIFVKKLYSDLYSIKNKTKYIFNCNEFPASKDGTEGLLRRIQIVPFNAEFDDKIGNVDKHIKKKLLTELPGIFNWAMEGYRRLARTKELSSSDRANDIYSEFKEAQDSPSSFVAQKIRYTANTTDICMFNDVYRAYYDWCDKTLEKYPKSKISFSTRFATLMKKMSAEKYRTNGARGYKGIRIRTEDERF